MFSAWIKIFGSIAIYLVIIVCAVQIGGVLHPVTHVVHIDGHECFAMRTGFSRSLSCDWGKP